MNANPIVNMLGLALGGYGAYRQDQDASRNYELLMQVWKQNQLRQRSLDLEMAPVKQNLRFEMGTPLPSEKEEYNRWWWNHKLLGNLPMWGAGMAGVANMLRRNRARQGNMLAQHLQATEESSISPLLAAAVQHASPLGSAATSPYGQMAMQNAWGGMAGMPPMRPSSALAEGMGPLLMMLGAQR